MTNKRRKNGIQHCRMRAGFATAAEVAAILKMPKKTYESWEQGFGFPRRDDIIKLRSLFRCTVDDLYNITQEETEAALAGVDISPTFEPIATKPNSAEDTIIASVEQLNKSGKESISALLQVLSSDKDEISGMEAVRIISLVNRSLAQRRGERGNSPVSAAV